MWMSAYRRIQVDQPERFEGIRETIVDLPGYPRVDRDALRAGRVQCQTGGPVRSTAECLSCAHLVNFRPGPGAERVTLRCLYCDNDSVAEVMTLETHVCTVDAATSVALADEIARRRGIRHLVVANEDQVVGVVCRCDLVPPVEPDEKVASRMVVLPCAISLGATLGEAAAAMRAYHIAMLLVVDEDQLVGVVTRGDLRRVGVPEELLGAHSCMACGSTHGVCCPRGNPGAEFCLECIDKAGTSIDDDEPGGGD